ncbi:MBL fold metallo-hydrolase [Sphingomonas oleivorans]|uniref:MBL fold metallo-hydrolase n=1 Tax=Sphingomonas oleivorans TaxID=1735121 RepID=A0A2T5G1A0_9SPHN|nr:MBL fold metallo-hydrolase [Sphingomonas oleivorans]PTQ12891.1 MBL fold metallo-hydrolase [Sphingomonas oleivorans]
MTEQTPGLAQALHPLVRRLLAPNPSAFTYKGTQTYLVGRGEIAVIDPGPDLPEHVDAILQASAGERIGAIICTHTHRDHSPASRALKAATGAPIMGCAPLALNDEGPRADAAFDTDYAPDRVLADGERVSGPGWTLEAVATPGHTSNHLCFALREANALFTGDHVMGWSTTVISPPDGDMADYMASLDRLMARDDIIYYPAHGEPVEKPQRFVRSLVGHRKQREGQILRLLGEGARPIPAMVEKMYVGIDPRLHGAAGRSVLAHLIDMETRGLVARAGDGWALAA